jgi:hypothetical protein
VAGPGQGHLRASGGEIEVREGPPIGEPRSQRLRAASDHDPKYPSQIALQVLPHGIRITNDRLWEGGASSQT